MKKSDLEKYITRGLSTHEIARTSEKSQTTVRYWLKKHGLKTVNAQNAKRKQQYSDTEFSKAVRKNISVAAVIRTMGRALSGTNYRWVHAKVSRLKLSTTHWRGQAHGTGVRKIRPLSEVLTKDSTYSRKQLKKRLIKNRILENKCAICGISPIWNGKPMTLRLDHINGVRNDNRKKNLRLLCPNCDSQTDTYCGRNKRR